MAKMISREAVQTILKKHRVSIYDYAGSTTVIDVDALCADLLALVPTPSREALEKLLNFYRHGGGAITVMREEEFIEKLMAWALGQPERWTWCIHMRHDEQFPSRWVYLTTLHAADLWTYCPSCGTKRPQEPSPEGGR